MARARRTAPAEKESAKPEPVPASPGRAYVNVFLLLAALFELALIANFFTLWWPT